MDFNEKKSKRRNKVQIYMFSPILIIIHMDVKFMNKEIEKKIMIKRISIA